MTPSIAPMIRLLNEDPEGWWLEEHSTYRHRLGFRIYRCLDGSWTANGHPLGFFETWALVRALSRRDAWYVERFLAHKAEAELQALLGP